MKEYVSHAMHKLEAPNRIEAVRKAVELGLVDVGAPTERRDPETQPATLVYNETGTPVRASELKVPPLKLDRLRAPDTDG